MTVEVERCWSGSDKYEFRLTFPSGERECVRGYEWDRKVAGEALNIAEHLYGAERRRVRFRHIN